MASPFFPYRNTRIRVVTTASVAVVNGRLTETAGDIYLYEAYGKRMQYTGVTSGSERVPLFSQLGGRMLPGADGDKWYYRGYLLRKAVIPEDFDWEDWDADDSALTWIDVVVNQDELKPQIEVDAKIGNEDTTHATIQRSTGRFGGRGIDEEIYAGIQGVEVQLTATDLL